MRISRPVCGGEIESRFVQPVPRPDAVLEGGQVEVYQGVRYRWTELGVNPAKRVAKEMERRRQQILELL